MFTTERICLLILMFLTLGTIQRNYVWGSEKTLWQDVIAKQPDSAPAYLNLAVDFNKSGDYEAAFHNYQTAMKLVAAKTPPDRYLLAKAEANMGNMLLQMPHATAGDLKAAESALRGSLSLIPANGLASLGLASLLNGQGRHYEALRLIDDAERAQSDTTTTIQEDQLHFEKGVALCGLHQIQQSNSQLTKAASMGFGIKPGICGPEGNIHVSTKS